MSRGFSRVVLVGNLGRDPEMRYLPSGDPVVNFSIAVSRRRRGQDGNMQEETDWYRINCFRRNAEIADQYLRKGSQVLVDGQLQIRQYTGNDGVERTSVEVNCDNFTMLGSRDGNNMGGGGDYQSQGSQGGGPDSGGQPQQGQQRRQQKDNDFDDFDDVPF
jgi:single-strand DNA-binding protein